MGRRFLGIQTVSDCHLRGNPFSQDGLGCDTWPHALELPIRTRRIFRSTAVQNQTSTLAYVISVIGGVTLWLAATALGGRREAWDAAIYWTLAYPISMLIAGGLGYLVPDRPWRWGLTIMLAQALALAYVNNDFGLLPLGMMLFSVLALPPIGFAVLAGKLRQKINAIP